MGGRLCCPCTENCVACDGPGYEDCLQCDSGYVLNDEDGDGAGSCADDSESGTDGTVPDCSGDGDELPRLLGRRRVLRRRGPGVRLRFDLLRQRRRRLRAPADGLGAGRGLVRLGARRERRHDGERPGVLGQVRGHARRGRRQGDRLVERRVLVPGRLSVHGGPGRRGHPPHDVRGHRGAPGPLRRPVPRRRSGLPHVHERERQRAGG